MAIQRKVLFDFIKTVEEKTQQKNFGEKEHRICIALMLSTIGKLNPSS